MLEGFVRHNGNSQNWPTVPIRSFLRRLNVSGDPSLTLLGVGLREGVRPRFADDGRPSASEDLTSYKRVRQGDVVMNRLGKPHGSVGVSGYHGITSPAYWVMEVDRSRADPQFVHYLLRSRHMIREYGRLGKFMPPNQFDLSWELFRGIEVPLPSVANQHQISCFLKGELSRIREMQLAQRRLRELLLERREARVFASVTGQDRNDSRASELEWVDRLPAVWGSVKLSRLARMGSGHTPSRARPEWWVDCRIPWITTGEVSQFRNDRREVIVETREKISELGIANSSAEVHPAGTVVLCRTASAGYSAIMGDDMATSQDFVTWTCGPKLINYYLLWCLRAMRRDLLGRLATGSTHKTIYVPDLQALRIPLPDLTEQRQVVEEVHEENSKLDGLIDTVDRQLLLLEERSDSLITAAVTGQIDVTTARGVDV